MAMGNVDPNYFTCTLGEAAIWKRQSAENAKERFKTVVDLVDVQATASPHSLALGFADFTRKGSTTNCTPLAITFQEFKELSISASHVLSRRIDLPENETVGLLCTSSIEFALTWQGLVRLGYSVLLLAPQLEPSAIDHLCNTLEAHIIFVDERYSHRTRNIDSNIRVLNIPPYQEYASADFSQAPEKLNRLSDFAYFCHTSGTSSGLPKPLSQTHFGVVGALPCFPGNEKPATFSTTPMYHGGLVDCFRAWTSGAMVWFFPEGVVPITAANLMSAIAFAREESSVSVKYFSSVPYVLQMLAEEDEGTSLLRTMELVGVGGAALPAAVGDELVKAGVNLLSRMGSAECGFLMSSHRDYQHDKDWQYLRPINDRALLEFEPRDGALSELVVKPDWPFLVKTNREDGSYATSDLFEPHETIPNAWRYHSRADAQIVLANGKKFDPSPLESTILASSKLLQDVLIFGSGKDYAGALLFPRSNDTDEQNIIGSIWPSIEKMNSESQNHARITKVMLVVVPIKTGQVPLEKSSKGTILRRQAEERYAKEIKSAYDGSSSLNSGSVPALDEELASTVHNCFSRVLGRTVDPSVDLYRQSVDSLSCIQIRKLVELSCLPKVKRPLPMNVIYDHGTVNALTEYLRSLRQGIFQANGNEQCDQLALMKNLAKAYSDFSHLNPSGPRGKSGKVIVLTGSTGFLGAHILHLLRHDSEISKIYCLLRAHTPFAAHERVTKALSKRNMPGLEDYADSPDAKSKVVCLPCNLFKRDLGLSKEDRGRICDEATLIIHSAWTVNFSIHLKSFEDQIAGTRNLIDLAAESGAKFFFISSTAAVSSSVSAPIPEKVSYSPAEASPLGYSRSKWVAEQVCIAANDRLTEETSATLSSGNSVSIVRVGQLCSNNAGAWNVSEAYPLMLSTASITGCLPDLPEELLDWIPVEQAAQAVLEIAFSDGNGSNRTDENGTVKEPPVYHVLNPHANPTWNHMLQWLMAESKDCQFEVVSPKDWVERLERTLQEQARDHPSQALLGLWKGRFGSYKDANGETKGRPNFDVAVAQQASATMKTLGPLDRQRIMKMWKWVRENIHST